MRRANLALLCAAMFLASCSSDGDKASNANASRKRVTTSTTSTTLPPTTTTVVPVPVVPQGLRQGSKGPEVVALQRRLAELHFDIGTADGSYGSGTYHAVMAFQKTHGLNRTGNATPDVLAALATAGNPAPLVPGGGRMRVEVDLHRQVLFLYKNDQLNRILSISTGNNKRYCVEGQCAYAVTPGGSFKITRRIQGQRVSKLGTLWNPLYFNGGIAIHGSPSVPGYPASHGCVRITMSASGWFFSEVPNGTPVYVIGGKKAPVPFNEPAPGDPPPPPPPPPPSSTTTAPPPTTTTTAPPVTTSTTI